MSDAALPATHWEGRDVSYWAEHWHVPALHVFTIVGSTNDVARTLATEAAPAGTIVIAEQQTAGRGRFGRQWQAPAASSLLLSCLLRPRAEGDAVPATIPLRVGLAAALAIDDATGVQTALKWPNDLVLTGAGKLGGILCEAITTGDHWSVVAGIGINVRSREWPPELHGRATSLDDVAGAKTDRARLAGSLIERLRPLFTAPLALLSASELDAFRARDALAGKHVVVEDEVMGKAEAHGAARRSGLSAGIAPDGALLIRTDFRTERITTGTVRIADEHGRRPTTAAYP